MKSFYLPILATSFLGLIPSLFAGHPGPILKRDVINPNYLEFIGSLPELIDLSYKATLQEKDHLGNIYYANPDLLGPQGLQTQNQNQTQNKGQWKKLEHLHGKTGQYRGFLRIFLPSPKDDRPGFIAYRCLAPTQDLPQKMQLALIVRGSQTQSFENIATSADWKNNLSFRKTAIDPKLYGSPTGKNERPLAQSGYYDKAESIFPSAKKQVDTLLQEGVCGIQSMNEVQTIVAGHSQGAAVATLLLQRIYQAYYSHTQNFFQGLLTGIFISSPKVADPHLEKLIAASVGYEKELGTGNILNIAGLFDLVTAVGLGESSSLYSTVATFSSFFILPYPLFIAAMITLWNKKGIYKTVGIPIYVKPKSILEAYSYTKHMPHEKLYNFLSPLEKMEESFLLYRSQKGIFQKISQLRTLLYNLYKTFVRHEDKHVDIVCLMHFGNPQTGYFGKEILDGIMNKNENQLNDFRTQTVAYLRSRRREN